MAEKKSVYQVLSSVIVNDYTKKKGNLTYLSWVYAWGKVKELFPDATYKVYENANGMFYHTDGKTCWVKCSVTINSQEHIEYLPVMDMRNQSIPYDKVTSTEVNKAIQRCITKACARHGLGIYIYAGEDMPIETEEVKQKAIQEYADACDAARDYVLGAKTRAELQQILNENSELYNAYRPFTDLVNKQWNKLGK